MSRRGTVVLSRDAGEPEQVIDRLAAALDGLSARQVRRERGAVTFRGGMFRFVTNWNLLVPISWGRVEVRLGAEGLEARYHIAFTELVAVATLFVGMAAVPIILAAGPNAGAVRYVAPLVMWAWVVGVNIAIALVRFPAFLRRVR